MDKRQKQVIDTFVRVRSFLDAHPATGALGYTDARTTLEDVIQRLDQHASAQFLGHEQSRAEARRQDDQIELIRDLHMRPIVAIAQAQIAPGSDVGLPAGLRMPSLAAGPTRTLAASNAMIEAARPFEALFVSKGLPADFLAQFEAARDTLINMRGNRSAQVGRHVTARAGLFVELRRGRRAVNQLDAIVRAAFRGNFMTLSAWRSAKRVHLLGGGAGAPTVPEVTEGASTQAAA
jgi:hypothetical protein